MPLRCVFFFFLIGAPGFWIRIFWPLAPHFNRPKVALSWHRKEGLVVLRSWWKNFSIQYMHRWSKFPFPFFLSLHFWMWAERGEIGKGQAAFQGYLKFRFMETQPLQLLTGSWGQVGANATPDDVGTPARLGPG